MYIMGRVNKLFGQINQANISVMNKYESLVRKGTLG